MNDKIVCIHMVSSDPENLENLEISGNLKMGPKGKGKVREFEKAVKVSEIFQNISNRFLVCYKCYNPVQTLVKCRRLVW